MDNLAQILIPVLTFLTVLCIGGAVVSGSLYRRKILQARLDNLTVPRQETLYQPIWIRFLSGLGLLASANAPSANLRMQLLRAGFHGRMSVSVFLGAKVLLFIGGCAATFALLMAFDLRFMIRLLAVLSAGSFLFFLPNVYLDIRRKSRSVTIAMHLPDVVDLMEICVSGGMGLDAAWNAVTDEIRTVCPLIADEMALTNLEIHLGEDRGSAIRHMAERTGAKDLLSLVAVLVQSQRFGTTVSEALRLFASNLRQLRSQRAEEYAEKMAVKLLFPMVVLIFPVIIIVAVGPAGITLFEMFSK